MKTQDVRMSVTKEEERQMERVNIVLKIIRIDSYLHATRLDVHCTLYSVTFLQRFLMMLAMILFVFFITYMPGFIVKMVKPPSLSLSSNHTTHCSYMSPTY